jgi:putative flippase GtrA
VIDGLLKQRPALRSGLWFLAVGGAAALTHFIVFTLARRVMLPDVANPIGFIVAFWVSFWGHRRLTFTDAGTTAGQSLWRFAVTSLAGFAGNELFFVALYRGLHWPPSLAWFAAAVLAAGQTFILSRFWAFRR